MFRNHFFMILFLDWATTSILCCPEWEVYFVIGANSRIVLDSPKLYELYEVWLELNWNYIDSEIP